MKTMKAMKKAKPMKAMIFQKKTKKAMKAMKPMKPMKAMKNIASNAMSFQIVFESAQNKIIFVDVKASDTVDQLKTKIQAGGCGLTSISSLMVRMGQPWMGDTLADFGLKKYSIVTEVREYLEKENEVEKVKKELNEGATSTS
jgi:hypothetical protein